MVLAYVLIGMAMLAGFARLCAANRGRRLLMLPVCVIAFFIGGGIFSMVLTSAALLVAALSVACAAIPSSPRTYHRLVLGTLGLLSAWSTVDGLRQVVGTRRLQAEFPFESLEARLATLDAASPQTGVVATSDHPSEAPESTRIPSEERFELWRDYTDDMRRRPWTKHRRHALESIHASAVQAFVDSPGFGSERMKFVTRADEAREVLDAPQPDLLPLRDPSSDSDTTGTPDGGVPSGGDLRAIDSTLLQPHSVASRKPTIVREIVDRFRLRATHLRSVEDFLDDDRFGLFHGPDRVAGFQSHRFARVPKISGDDVEDVWTKSDYRLARLELVSLLRHPEPQVYVSESLPQMDALDGTATRDLDPFEARALRALRSGSDVESASEGTGLRMLGSLRAVQVCRDCHKVGPGTLLGAFSYRFHHVPSATGDPAP